MNTKNIILLSFVLLIFTSCCTTRVCKVERAEKKITKLTTKFPELLQNDTIVVSDTLTIETIKADTAFISTNTNDTVVITNDRVTIRYVKKDSLIYIEGECKGDTVIVTKEIPIETVVVRELTWSERAKEYTYFLFAIAALLLVVRIFFKDVFKIFNIFK
tara:strand:+ start:1699 stop:2178 length:480 start_codon:yes stop_codon:yes gene_type:complete